ncbi:MAG: hypothetical protein IPG17_01745 [Sandaracinaceae bacterium]|nr:hypothetical protein [Sandaracinaceae bacterium]
MWWGFVVALVGFTLVGVAASSRARDSVDDYLLAGRSVPPLLAGLSAVATNNSGFMFVGLLGFAYTSGPHALAFQLAWLLGDLGTWVFAQRRVRERSGALSSRPSDAAQAVVMFLAMLAIIAGAWERVGSPVALLSALERVDPALVTWTPATSRFGVPAYLLAFVLGGSGRSHSLTSWCAP